MSYRAYCNGRIGFDGPMTDKVEKELEHIFPVGYGYEYYWDSDNVKSEIYFMYNGNYHEDDVIGILDDISKLITITLGECYFSGEDDTFWRFIFRNGMWVEQNGTIVYEDAE